MMSVMSDTEDAISVAVFSEILALDQLLRSRVAKVLPKGMELSHFAVLNHLAHVEGERTPAQLAQTFNLTRGAMTNTLTRLEAAGHIHIRPDWDDARRKWVAISGAGTLARDSAMAAIMPLISQSLSQVENERLKQILPVLRQIRHMLVE